MTTPKMVEIDPAELAELRKLQSAQAAKKVKSSGRAKARQELIKRHKSEYDGLVTQFSG